MLTAVRDRQWDDLLIVVALVIGLLWDTVSASLSNDRKAFLIRPADSESDMSVFSSPQRVQTYLTLQTAIPRGFGRHIWTLPHDATPMFLRTLVVFELFFGLTICLNKLSM